MAKIIKTVDDKLAARLPGVLSLHEIMLADGVRNRVIFKALTNLVDSGTSVLDVGAGTGIWAILAAKLGAKRVVAIESEECLIPMIRSIAIENGVGDKIEIIHGRAENVKLRERFDVVISELFGGDGLGLATVGAMIDVRDRFLANSGAFLPNKLAMFAVPANVRSPKLGDLGETALNMNTFVSLRSNFPRTLPIAERGSFAELSKPAQLAEVDFRAVKVAEPQRILSAEWDLERLDNANAVIVFNRSTFGPRLVLDGRRSRTWGVYRFDFQPYSKRVGTLTFRMTLDRDNRSWTVGVKDSNECPEQSFGPVFAASRIQFGLATTPHKKS